MPKFIVKVYSQYGAVMFLFFIGDALIDLALPLFFIDKGLSYSYIGALLSAFGFGIVFFNILFGSHSDYVGRKPYIVFPLYLTGIIVLLISLTNNIAVLALLLFAKGIVRSAFFSVRSPYIKEISNVEQRGKAFGFIGACSTTGLAIGGVVTGSLSMQVILIVVSLLYVGAGFFAALILPKDEAHSFLRKKNANIEHKQIKWSDYKKLPKEMWTVFFINFIENIVSAQLWSLVLPVYLTSVIGLSPRMMGFVFAADNTLGIPASILGGFLADKFHSKKVYINITICTALLGFCLIFSDNKIIFTVLLLVFMTLFSIASPVLEKIESIVARDETAGFDLSLITVATSLGTSIGQILTGLMMEHFGEASALYIVGFGYITILGVFQCNMRNVQWISKNSDEMGNENV